MSPMLPGEPRRVPCPSTEELLEAAKAEVERLRVILKVENTVTTETDSCFTVTDQSSDTAWFDLELDQIEISGYSVAMTNPAWAALRNFLVKNVK